MQPTGRYSHDDHAKTGKGATLDACFYFKNRKWGLGFEMSTFNSEFESSELNNRLRSNMSSNDRVTIDHGTYSGSWLALGPQYSSKMNRWITWDVRFALGVMRLSTPWLDYLYSNNGNINVHYFSENGLGTSFIRSFSTGFRFNVTKRFALKLSFRLAGSNSIVKYHTEFAQTDSLGKVVSSFGTSDNKKQILFQCVSGLLGLSYTFGDDRIKPDHRKMYGKYPPSYIEAIYGFSGPLVIKKDHQGDDQGNNNYSNYNDEFSNSAKQGKHGNIDGCIYLKNRKWGLGFDLTIFDNKFDSDQLNRYLVSNNNVQTSYGKYSGEWIAIGPQFSPKISRWLIWDLRFSVGAMGFSKPYFNYTYRDAANNKLEYKLDKGFGMSLVKTFTTGFRCYLTDRVALRLFIQAAESRSTVKYNESLIQTDAGGTVTNSSSQDRKKQIHYATINTGLGLSYQFGRNKN
jgi:hypothetical protein